MDFRNFIEDIMTEMKGSTFRGLFIEEIIGRLLNTFLKEENKEYILEKNVYDRIHYDGYIPDGFGNLKGITVVEIKSYLNKSNYFNNKNIEKLISNLNFDKRIGSVLFVFLSEFSESDIKKINRLYDSIFAKYCVRNLEFRILDLTDLDLMYSKLDDKNRKELEYFIFNYRNNYISFNKLNIEKIISDSTQIKKEDLSKIKNDRISNIKKAYLNDDLVLFLGAGVSKDANIVDWNELISDLLIKLIKKNLNTSKNMLEEKEFNYLLNKMKNQNDSAPLLQARYIKTGLGNEFEKFVSEALYKKVTPKIGGTSVLLEELAKLCIPKRSKIGVKSIVTYNFDDLLEFNLKSYGVDFKAIYRDGDFPDLDELGIYHVHGFLPRNPSDYDNLSQSLLIFSEDGYHELYQSPYSWSNLVQLNFFRENTCLLIGLSLTDPNLRRLLEIAHRKNEKPKHFAFLKKQIFKNNNEKISIDDSIIVSFEISNQELLEKYYEDLGVEIIWVDDYSEIPKIIKIIKNRDNSK